jgi:GNAT superfamily N-acetyltransferase
MTSHHPIPGDPMDRDRIEIAALNAWPALEEIDLDGWRVRFADGYTKRANSVTPLRMSSGSLEQKVERCEALFRERNLPPTFRLLSHTDPDPLDVILEARGYSVLDPTRVQYLDLKESTDAIDGDAGPPLEDWNDRLDDWLAAFHDLAGESRPLDPTHRQLLDAISGDRFPAVLRAGPRVVTCGLGVREDDLVGLFDCVTAVSERRQGHGTSLVKGLLDWGRGRGGRHAYLQVVTANEPACRLYARLGFRDSYTYWYRRLEPRG